MDATSGNQPPFIRELWHKFTETKNHCTKPVYTLPELGQCKTGQRQNCRSSSLVKFRTDLNYKFLRYGFSTPSSLRSPIQTDKTFIPAIVEEMAFHRFQQLPTELRLLVWECAVHETFIDDLTDGQKPVSRIVEPQPTSECPNPATKLVTLEDLTIAYVCHESREVFRRCGRLSNAYGYTPATDVVYIDDYDHWVALDVSKARQVHHIALSADFCYDSKSPIYNFDPSDKSPPSVARASEVSLACRCSYKPWPHCDLVLPILECYFFPIVLICFDS